MERNEDVYVYKTHGEEEEQAERGPVIPDEPEKKGSEEVPCVHGSGTMLWWFMGCAVFGIIFLCELPLGLIFISIIPIKYIILIHNAKILLIWAVVILYLILVWLISDFKLKGKYRSQSFRYYCIFLLITVILECMLLHVFIYQVENVFDQIKYFFWVHPLSIVVFGLLWLVTKSEVMWKNRGRGFDLLAQWIVAMIIIIEYEMAVYEMAIQDMEWASRHPLLVSNALLFIILFLLMLKSHNKIVKNK